MTRKNLIILLLLLLDVIIIIFFFKKDIKGWITVEIPMLLILWLLYKAKLGDAVEDAWVETKIFEQEKISEEDKKKKYRNKIIDNILRFLFLVS